MFVVVVGLGVLEVPFVRECWRIWRAWRGEGRGLVLDGIGWSV